MERYLLLIVITLGAIPVQSQSGRVLVVNKASHSVSVVDVATLRQTAEIPVGKGPHELAVADDGKIAYVANYGVPAYGHTISVVDITAGRELRTIDLGALYRPHCIVFRNNRLYFTAEANRAIARYDLAANRLDWIAGTGQDGAHMLVVSPDEKRVYVANRGSHTVTVVETGSAQPGAVLQLSTDEGPEGIDISPQGHEVWVGNTRDGSVNIIDVASGTIVQKLAVGKSLIRIRFTPDGSRVIVSDNAAGEVIIMDATTRAVIKRLPAKDAPMGIAITADGKTAFIAHGAADYISLLDMKKMVFTGAVKVGRQPDGMVWMP